MFSKFFLLFFASFVLGSYDLDSSEPTYSCLPAVQTSTTADLNDNLLFLIADSSSAMLNDYITTSQDEITYNGVTADEPNMAIVFLGYFAPSEAGWYELQVTNPDRFLLVEFFDDNYSTRTTSFSKTQYSVKIYANGVDSSGSITLYPFLIQSMASSIMTITVLKDSTPVDPESVFYNSYDGEEPREYLSGQVQEFDTFSTICSSSSTSTSTSSSSTSSSSTSSSSTSSSSTSSSSTSSSSTSTSSTSSTPTSTSSTSTTTTSLNSTTTLSASSTATTSFTSSTFDSLLTSDSVTSSYSNNTLLSSLYPSELTSYQVESSFTTELITITSCSENKCSIVTEYTTYCPLTASGSEQAAVTGNLGGSIYESISSSVIEQNSEITSGISVQEENSAAGIMDSIPLFGLFLGSLFFVYAI